MMRGVGKKIKEDKERDDEENEENWGKIKIMKE